MWLLRVCVHGHTSIIQYNADVADIHVVWIELRGCLHVELQGVDGFFTIVVLMAPVVCHSVQAYAASVMSEHQ